MDYHIYAGMVNIHIGLGDNNQISYLQFGELLEQRYFRRNYLGKDEIDRGELMQAFKFMIAYNPNDFKELCEKIRKADPEMFRYAEQVITEIIEFCSSIPTE